MVLVEVTVTDPVGGRRQSDNLELDLAVEKLVASGLGDVDGPIPHHDRQRSIRIGAADGVDQVAGSVAVDFDLQTLVPKLFEHPQRPPPRLAQVADGEQAEPAVQQLRRPSELLEVVGGRPVGESVDASHRARPCRG